MMYTVTVKRGAKIEHWAQFPNLRDALRQLDGFVHAFPDLVSELRGASGVLWSCRLSQVQASAGPSEAI
jgi:hypothetical protein